MRALARLLRLIARRDAGQGLVEEALVHVADHLVGDPRARHQGAGAQDERVLAGVGGKAHAAERRQQAAQELSGIRLGGVGVGRGARGVVECGLVGPAAPDLVGQAPGILAASQGLGDGVKEGEVGVQDLAWIRGDGGVGQRGAAPPAGGLGGSRDESGADQGLEVLSHGVVVQTQHLCDLGGAQGPVSGLDRLQHTQMSGGQFSPR